MKTKILILCLAAGLGVGGLVGLKAMAAENGGFGLARSRKAQLLERVREKLQLTPEQVTQIRTVIRADRDHLTGLFTRWHAARVELRTAIQADAANETTVRAAAAKVAAVEADAAVERMKLFHQISPLLTTEQRTQFGEMQARLDDFIDAAVNRAAAAPAQ